MVKYIVQVYGPTWFNIKKHPKFTNGPKLLFEKMNLINHQTTEVQDIVKKHVQHNAYFAEPGLMLVCMLASNSKEVGCQAVEMVKKWRSKPAKPPRARLFEGMRKFTIPRLQWQAEAWPGIIDWDTVQVFQPFVLEKLSTEELENAKETPVDFPDYPCHSQSVERAVKLVTEASQVVCGEMKRHEHIVSVIASRKSRKAFDTKKDYFVDTFILK